MKRTIGILALGITLLSFNSSNLNGFITLFEKPNNAKYYKYGKSHFFESFDKDKEVFNGKEYYVKYRRYSWGTIDTTYYRKDSKNYYHIDKKTMKESIVLPVNPNLGDNWMEHDKSWSYEIIDIKQKFKTPAKNYKNCIKVLCKQLTNRDKNKRAEYLLYYSPEFGYVGNVDSNGNILSYLSEVILNAKEGDKIGGK